MSKFAVEEIGNTWFCVRTCEPGFEWQMDQRIAPNEAATGSFMKMVDP